MNRIYRKTSGVGKMAKAQQAVDNKMKRVEVHFTSGRVWAQEMKTTLANQVVLQMDDGKRQTIRPGAEDVVFNKGVVEYVQVFDIPL